MHFATHFAMTTAATAYAIATTFGAAPILADDSYNSSQQSYTRSSGNDGAREAAADAFSMRLTPSSVQLGQCTPNAQLDVNVQLTTRTNGSDNFEIRGQDLAPNGDYTVVLLEQAGAPFGAAEYIGDLNTDANVFNTIVQEGLADVVKAPAAGASRGRRASAAKLPGFLSVRSSAECGSATAHWPVPRMSAPRAV